MKIHATEPDTLVLHQSDIGHYLTCPEQFRWQNGILPGGDFEKDPSLRVETDAATVGTVTHATIENELSEGRFPRVADAQRWARNFMGALVMEYVEAGTEYRTQSFGEQPAKALAALDTLVKRWFDSEIRQQILALHQDHPGHIIPEWNFEVPFLQNREGRYKNVKLAGTADILDTYNHRLIDWKTTSSGHNYKRWEKQRWAVQPTVYTFAAAALGLLERHSDGYQFDFRVFTYKAGDTAPIEVTAWRDQGQWGWLALQVSNMVDMVESDLKAWPLRDDHALCGPKWCGNWSSCKGAFVSPEWT